MYRKQAKFTCFYRFLCVYTIGKYNFENGKPITYKVNKNIKAEQSK